MTTLYRERMDFERALLAALKPRLRGSGWKLKRSALMTETDGMYLDIMVRVYRNARHTVAELRCKPMAVDPILWDILDLPENHRAPLSFRTWGAFTCSAIPVAEQAVEHEDASPDATAERLIAFREQAISLVRTALAAAPFSALAAAHPNQIARGAYAITLCASLIAERKLAEASGLALRHAIGLDHSSFGMTSGGASFHERALAWLAAGQVDAAG